jgi:hypothetical protein
VKSPSLMGIKFCIESRHLTSVRATAALDFDEVATAALRPQLAVAAAETFVAWSVSPDVSLTAMLNLK